MAASINADPDRATNSDLVRPDVSNESHLNRALVEIDFNVLVSPLGLEPRT
jgi:hypothetical protein